jgi:hypothetical protein
MSRKERLIAGVLLVVAVGGGALIPRLLATPAAPLGVALGQGPGPSVVQAPTIPQTGHHTSQRTTSLPRVTAGTPAVAVTPIALQPQTTSAGRPKRASVSPPAPPAVTVPLNPSPPPTQPAAAVRQPPAAIASSGEAKTPPGQAKKLSGLARTPPGQAKKLHAPGPPSPAKHSTGAGRRNAHSDLPGSGHGRPDAQTPSHPVGPHHRGVGHLAPPPSRPASPARTGRPQARAEDRGRRGKGGDGTSSAPVAPGNGQNGHGKGRGD